MKHSTILIVLLVLSQQAYAENQLMIGCFSCSSLENWSQKKFDGTTEYQLIKEQDKTVLKAHSHASASGLVKKINIDLKKTPFLNWSWQIKNRLTGLSEKSKSGDDYAARIYIIIDGGLKFWQTKAINYVWSGSMAKGNTWPNAFAGENAMMIAIRTNTDNLNVWYKEKRNILNDIKKILNSDRSSIDAIAIMTDTDNSNNEVTALYGDIYFTEN